jgi:isoleucyl-tRNA synthetase
MKAKVKRRWPLRKAYYLVGQNERDLVLENKELLLEQTNLSDVELVSDPAKLPISITVKPNFELVAPRAKARMNELSAKLAKADAKQLFNELSNKDKTRLLDMDDFELTQSDLIFTFASSDPKYVVSENYGIVVALDSSRDEQLIAQGVVRDLARNLQALRKEKGFNPTDILTVARVSGLNAQTIALIEPRKEELAFLVRVKSVELNSSAGESWSSTEIDGTEVKLDIS